MSEILKRASSIRTRTDDSDGISLQELQQIGAELGYDPADIELAATQLRSTATAPKGFINPRIVVERTVDGEATADDWKGMIGVIQRYHKGAGAVSERGMNYDWAGSEEGAGLALTVTAQKGRTRIRLESNRWMEPIMASVFCPVFGFVFTSVLAKHGHPIGAIAVGVAMATLWVSALRFFRLHHQQLVSGLMERLAGEVRSENADHRLVNSTPVVTDSENHGQSVQA